MPNQLKIGALLNYVIIGLNTLVGLLYTPFMLRCLGQNEYGIYSLVASIIAYLTILDFGFGNAIIRYTAKYRAENKLNEQWEMFGMFLIIYCFIGVLVLCGGLVLYENVGILFKYTMNSDELSQARTMMLLLTFNLAVTFPLGIFGSIITAYENFIFQRVVNILRILLSTIVLIVVLSAGFKAVALVVVQTVFNLLTLLVNWIYCKRRLQIRIILKRIDWRFLKEISSYSFWIFLNVIMDKIYWGTGQFVLGSVCGTVAVAIFSVAILLQQLYMQFSTSISSVLLPRLTSMVSLNYETSTISEIFIRTGRLQCYIMTLILSGFIVFGNAFISLWAGREYSESYIITLIFFVSLFIPLIQNTGIVILQARNQLKFRSILYLILSLVSLLLQILLAKIWGVVGCAIAIGGALLVGQGLIMNLYYQIKQHLEVIKFWKEIGQILIVPIALVCVGLLSQYLVNYFNWINLIVGIMLFTLLECLGYWFFSMNQYEKHLILDPLQKLKR